MSSPGKEVGCRCLFQSATCLTNAWLDCDSTTVQRSCANRELTENKDKVWHKVQNNLFSYVISSFQAYVRRFPKCPLIPVFVDSEIVSQSQNDDGSLVMTERRCTIDVDAPRLLKRVPPLFGTFSEQRLLGH